MKEITAFQSDDGTLETDARRAKAHDIARAFDRIASEKSTGSIRSSTKIDWHVAMELLENYEMLKAHIDDYEGWLEAEKMKAEIEEAKAAGMWKQGDKPIQTTVIPPSDDPAVNAHDKMINTKPIFIPKSHGGAGELD